MIHAEMIRAEKSMFHAADVFWCEIFDKLTVEDVGDVFYTNIGVITWAIY